MTASSNLNKWFIRWIDILWLSLIVCVCFVASIRIAYADPQLFHPLNEISSVDGVLTATIDVKPQTINLDGATFDGYTYNGDYAAPLLRVHPGDVMHIRLTNHLSDPTNLHFHGLHTSPLGNGDNIHTIVKSGESFDYQIEISPQQPPGLYWYHPHIHGISERMVNGGLSGALLVEGLRQEIPALAHTKEQVMVLKLYQAETASSLELKKLHKLVETINGQTFSTIAMHKGETQIWHILNPGADEFFHLSLKGHTFRIIEWDGVTVKQETVVDHLDLGPASRVAVLVNAGEQPGSFDLVSNKTPTGTGADYSDDRILGSVTVDDSTSAVAVPTITSFPDKSDLSTQKIDAYRTFTLSENALKGEYYINGKLFDHARTDTFVPLGNVEEWTIHNDSDDTHVFHIHQMHFQVIEINGVPQPFNGYLDTITVPERGEIKLIMPFTDPLMVGSFVYHCHVLEHEDKGMMQNIEVYNPKTETLFSKWRREYLPRLNALGEICGARSRGIWSKMRAIIRREMQILL